MTNTVTDYKARLNEVPALAKELDQSTHASWFWCLLFGPLWFAFIGSWKWFAISILAGIFTLGLSVFIMPFFAYKAHRDIAADKAMGMVGK